MNDRNVDEHASLQLIRRVLRPADQQRAAIPPVRRHDDPLATSAAQQSGPQW